MLVYLAQPYSSPDPAVAEGRFVLGCRAAAVLMARGVHLFAPIPHTHSIALRGTLPTDWAYWKAYDATLLARCTHLYVLTLPGWRESKGVRRELKIWRDGPAHTVHLVDVGDPAADPLPLTVHAPTTAAAVLASLDVIDEAAVAPADYSVESALDLFRTMGRGQCVSSRTAYAAADVIAAAFAALRKDRDEWKRDHEEARRMGNGLYAAIVERLGPYFPDDTRDLEWDVLPGTVRGLARDRRELLARCQLVADRMAQLAQRGDLHAPGLIDELRKELPRR